MPRGADPLGPENVLIFANGATTGAPVAGGGRNAMGAKSPLTGGYGEADVGGFFGAELQLAGYDALIVYGKAAEPVYLWIKDGEIEIRPAQHLWGKHSLETQDMLREELGDSLVRVSMIGPAGERLSRIACVMNDATRSAGRPGLGAVMGSKNLKAVAARGKQRVQMADPDGFRELSKWMRDNWKDKSWGMHDLGTAGGVDSLDHAGQLPTRNFQDGTFAGAHAISGEVMRDTIMVDRDSCYACAIACKRVVEVTEGPFKADPRYGGPEYETIGAVGSNCGVDDLAAVSTANELCNAYGLDTINAGMMVSFAMECFEAGLITPEDTDGLDLRFGNAAAMVEMIRRLGERTEGLGWLLGEGPKRAVRANRAGGGRFRHPREGPTLPDARMPHAPRPGVGLRRVAHRGRSHAQLLGWQHGEGAAERNAARLGRLRGHAADAVGPGQGTRLHPRLQLAMAGQSPGHVHVHPLVRGSEGGAGALDHRVQGHHDGAATGGAARRDAGARVQHARGHHPGRRQAAEAHEQLLQDADRQREAGGS